MPSPRPPSPPYQQRGASLLIFVVIMVVGIAALLVGSLSSSALNNSRQQQTAAALAQAKDSLIGRAAGDNTVPGSLPCPDTHAPGSSLEGTADFGTPCPNGFIGRLPWKTLGLPDIRDGSGERLWYALSSNYRDVTSTTVNSDTPGTISIFKPDGTLLNDGTSTGVSANGIVAVIISPGNVITRQGGILQDRSSTGFTTPSNYLDVATIGGKTLDNSVFTGSSTTTTGFIQGPVKDNSGNIIVNDQILVISRDQLMPVVETRIAREAKYCLDSYAANNGQRYPWAADVSDVTLYNSTNNTLFGRLPTVNLTSNDPGVNNMLSALSALQIASNNCATANNSSNANALFNAGNALENAAQNVASNQPTSPHIPSSISNPANQAGDKAQDSNRCGDINTNPSGNSVQTYLSQTVTALITTFPFPWTASCTLPTSSYWTDWENQIFYQTDTAYKPGGTLGIPSLKINGSGAYRGVVLVARKAINGQVRNSSNATTFLEGGNAHTNPTPATSFTTYPTSNSGYQTVNDLVLCLDGQVNCK